MSEESTAESTKGMEEDAGATSMEAFQIQKVNGSSDADASAGDGKGEAPATAAAKEAADTADGEVSGEEEPPQKSDLDEKEAAAGEEMGGEDEEAVKEELGRKEEKAEDEAKEPLGKKATAKKTRRNKSSAKKPSAAKEGKTASPKAKASSKTPTLEGALIVEGKRQRHSVERLTTDNFRTTPREVQIPKGSGTAFNSIECVDAGISTTRPEELKLLHRVCFGQPGKASKIRANLRQFRGFDFTKESEEHNKKRKQLDGAMMKDLKQISRVLGLERSGTKEELVERILGFLMGPVDSGKKAPAKHRRSAAKRNRSASKKKQIKRKDKEEKADAKEEEDSDEEEEEESGAEEEPPAKRTKTEAGRPSRSRQKKDPAPAKKSHPKLPSDGAITNVIKKLLKNVNLEKVTMKEMCKKVNESFPESELDSKKDFIKNTVKQIISAGE